MNIQEFKQAFPAFIKHSIVPYLHGSQGIGKTQVIKQCAKAHNLGFIHLHLATQEVGDLIGLLVKDDDGTVRHARPEWFPTEGKGIVFLDEINRGVPEVLNAMFSFITEGTLHRHKLPEGWKIIAAGNYQSNDFNVTDMSDAAWLSRFCHIDFKPTTEEFILHMESKNAFEVASFIRENPDLLEKVSTSENNLSFITPDRRSYDSMITPLENEPSIDAMRFEIYQGILGQAAASAFLTYKAKKEKAVSGAQVLNDYENVRKSILEYSKGDTSRLDMLSKTTNEIITKLIKEPLTFSNENNMNNLKMFVCDIPKELMLSFFEQIKKISSHEKFKLLNDKSLGEMLLKSAGINK